MHDAVERILLSEEQIQARVRELGHQIANDYRGKHPVMVCLLRGSFMFFSDLLKNIPILCTTDFMAVSSYGKGTKSSGQLTIKKDLSDPIEGKDVIIVEDILDSGFTLTSLMRTLSSRGAKSIKICTLLDKPGSRHADTPLVPDYSGFNIGDEFVVGYGLDYAEQYRNLPYIGILKREIYENAT
ncbi:MAG: hypoxanthine phosphoribosyltransferase [Christensenellales bacterium]|nr:hypoxanthine phosphoribosyltransferase [Christensenellales bacterium]